MEARGKSPKDVGDPLTAARIWSIRYVSSTFINANDGIRVTTHFNPRSVEHEITVFPRLHLVGHLEGHTFRR